jgi:hypothetical protein
MPFTLSGAVLTSNATDAVGFIYDSRADIDDWKTVGVKADVDTDLKDTGVAPVANTYVTLRIELSVGGHAYFFINGALAGTRTLNSVTAALDLCPVIAANALSTSGRTITVDYLWLKQARV